MVHQGWTLLVHEISMNILFTIPSATIVFKLDVISICMFIHILKIKYL